MKIIAMLATMLALSVGCSTQPPEEIAESLCAQVDQAYANQNVNQVLGFYDSSYVKIDHLGKRMTFEELRKFTEWEFAFVRNMNLRTTVEGVQLEGGRMVVYYEREMHFEFNDQRNGDGWVSQTDKSTGEETWERKSGKWKLIRSTISSRDVEVVPKRQAERIERDLNHRH
jgi:hypothetical protein